MDNTKLQGLKLSHSIIPKNHLTSEQSFWYAGEHNPTIKQNYLHIEPKQEPEEESWKDTVFMCYAVGTLVLIGLVSLISIVFSILYEQN